MTRRQQVGSRKDCISFQVLLVIIMFNRMQMCTLFFDDKVKILDDSDLFFELFALLR